MAKEQVVHAVKLSLELILLLCLNGFIASALTDWRWRRKTTRRQRRTGK